MEFRDCVRCQVFKTGFSELECSSCTFNVTLHDDVQGMQALYYQRLNPFSEPTFFLKRMTKTNNCVRFQMRVTATSFLFIVDQVKSL